MSDPTEWHDGGYQSWALDRQRGLTCNTLRFFVQDVWLGRHRSFTPFERVYSGRDLVKATTELVDAGERAMRYLNEAPQGDFSANAEIEEYLTQVRALAAQIDSQCAQNVTTFEDAISVYGPQPYGKLSHVTVRMLGLAIPHFQEMRAAIPAINAAHDASMALLTQRDVRRH